MKQAGRRTMMLDDLLRRSKAAPGSRNLFVDSDGWWEVVYTKRDPLNIVVFDEAGNVEWEKLIRPVPKDARPLRDQGE